MAKPSFKNVSYNIKTKTLLQILEILSFNLVENVADICSLLMTEMEAQEKVED